MLVGGFGLGICAGALVLSRIAERTNGSILAAALWAGALLVASTRGHSDHLRVRTNEESESVEHGADLVGLRSR
jgi:hypothetical protein